MSSGNQEPWIDLLCYDHEKTERLIETVRSEKFEPHPVSGEVEIDWDGQVTIRYRRVDEETLQALVGLEDLGLNVKLIWCVGDVEGGGDGWRIGEVSTIDLAEDSNWGTRSVDEAESRFESQTHSTTREPPPVNGRTTNGTNLSGSSWHVVEPAEEEEDDDDYWAQYDNTPARTPGPHEQASAPSVKRTTGDIEMSEEDAYYAQYSQVQPAMDNHDPDEEADMGAVESTLGRADIAQELRRDLPSHPEFTEASRAWGDSGNPFQPPPYDVTESREDAIRGRDLRHDQEKDLLQPRPASSSSSNGSATVERLERGAARQDQSEIGVKQHLATSVKSLYRLAKAAGIERGEFNRLVKTELDLLSLSDEE